MNKAQVEVIRKGGIGWEFTPSIYQQNRVTYYHKDTKSGKVVEHPNMPCDPYSLQRYLGRGFKLTKEDLSQAVEKSQEGFTCQVCEKPFPKRRALVGHMRSHQK
ncbi:hypothetical protein LCGC14_0560820 [marine sediment metagenome]|uniref:C2H2-type domain-containing protein n=1 Tax=marine sediment metagenome TaxID=412755 RepID=A0A0F9U8E7_9ZZZZ